ncbi:MAG: tripartite tricarboxylate transporter TctB family protein, partial [Sphaerochaetaceae bacterium]|nr:tripartite tricarboxylate transporter TctB family protein [Sphaerochaetaceae bacterium]
IIIVFGILVILGSLNLESYGELALTPGLFPFLLGFLIILLSTIMLIKNIKGTKDFQTNDNLETPQEKKKRLIDVSLFVAFSLLYLLMMKYLHFIIATIIYVFIAMLLMKERRASLQGYLNQLTHCCNIGV